MPIASLVFRFILVFVVVIEYNVALMKNVANSSIVLDALLLEGIIFKENNRQY